MPACFITLTFAAIVSLMTGGGSLTAQLRSEDSSSQRILPLPDGKLSSAETQMQLLQKLRSLVTASEDSTGAEAPSNDTPKIDDEQLEQLQQALKKLQEQLPPGIEPPDLDSIPKADLDEAISNPAVQQQLKKMLEQFSRDGLLPKSGEQNKTPGLPPLPRRRGESLTRPEGKRQTQPDQEPPPQPQPAEKSWQSLKDAMKKLSQIAQGGNQKSSDDVDPRQDPNPDENGNTDESRQHSLQAFQDLLERYKKSQRDNPPKVEGEYSEADSSDRQERRSGSPSHQFDSGERIPEQDPSKRDMRRSERATPVEPPISQRPRTSERGQVFPPAEIPSLNPPFQDENRANQQSGSRTEAGPEPDSSSDLIPSVSEFLKDQLRKGFSTPNGDRNGKAEQGSRTEIHQPENQPEMDIRHELDSHGIRGTIEKLVQKAREESNAAQRAQQQQTIAGEAGTAQTGNVSSQSGNAETPNATEKGTNAAGLQKSLKELLGALDGDMQDIIKDARFKDRDTKSPRRRDSARQAAPPDSESRLNKWNDAASNFLSDLSKAPQAPPSEQSPSEGSNSATADNPLAIGSFLMAGLGLLGLLAMIAICMRRPLLKIVSGATGFSVSNRSRPPGEIRSRADVISAFHELVSNPKQLIESWWTHRAAAQKLAAESPHQESAVRTLAEIYEQARYLPEDVELPAEKIQTARTAYAECR